MVFVYGLRERSDLYDSFCEFKARVEKEFDRPIKALKSDNAKEYINGKLNKLIKKKGIAHYTTYPHTPEDNGVAERMNRTLCESARCMLIQSGLTRGFWLYAIKHAAFVRNRCPSRSLPNNGIPFEFWSGKEASYSMFHIFGSTCYYKPKGENLGKMDERGREVIFIGHAEGSNQNLLCDKKNDRKFKSRDVCFLEDASPRVCTKDVLEIPLKNQDTDLEINQSDFSDIQITSPLRLPQHILEEDAESKDSSTETRLKFSTESAQPQFVSLDSDQNAKEMEVSSAPDPTNFGQNLPTISDSGAVLEESGGAIGQSSERLTNELRNGEADLDQLLQTVRQDFVRYKRDSSGRLVRVEGLAACSETPSDQNLKFESVMATPDAKLWFKAIEQEIQSLESMNTWTLVKRPPGALVITNTWVFKIKRRADNSIERYKARLVAHGFRQRPGFEYNETTAPVARISTIKMFLTVAHAMGMEVHQFDVTAAFLYGDLKENIYMTQPKGFISHECPESVCKLNKAMYGLKQAGHQWFLKLRSVMKSLGLQSSVFDCCVFMQTDPKDYVMLVVYVDDILIACKQPNTLSQIVKRLKQNFKITEKGLVNYFLGLEIGHDPIRGYWLSQEQYTKDMLDEFGFANCNSVKTPLVPREHIRKPDENEMLVNSTDYRRKIGRLNYLANHTRPDIAHAVHKLAQFSTAACVRHENHIKHIFRYLKGTKGYKFWLIEKKDLSINVFTDPSFASEVDDRKSFTGYVVRIGNAVVEWNFIKQKTVCKSTAEAEYVALSYGTHAILYFKQFMTELGLDHLMTKKPILYGDNTASITNADKFQSSRELRHIDIAYHITREMFSNGTMDIEHVPTNCMIADGLTKILDAANNLRMIKDLNLA